MAFCNNLMDAVTPCVARMWMFMVIDELFNGQFLPVDTGQRRLTAPTRRGLHRLETRASNHHVSNMTIESF